MIIRNDASSHIFLGLLAGRPMTEAASKLVLTKSYNALVSLLAEKRIYIE